MPAGDFAALQEVFKSVPLDEVRVELQRNDGPGKTLAWVTRNVFGPSSTIFVDKYDFAEVLPTGVTRRYTITPDSLLGLVLCHELVHVEQTRRGFWTRLRMWWAHRTQKYEDRWHEIEAHERDQALQLTWRELASLRKENTEHGV